MKKVIIILVLVLILGFIGYRAYVNYAAKKKTANQPVPQKIVAVETAQPSTINIVDSFHASANIQADSEITLYSKVMGKVAKNLVKMGSVVQPGQTVAIVSRDEVGFEFKDFEVKSDVKGVVSRLLQNAGAAVNPAVPLMTLVDIDRVKVMASVDEKKIRFIKMGQAAKVTLEAYPGETFKAQVTNISPVANPVNRTIDVELSLANPGYRIKPGMYAEVEWTTGQRQALVVPLAAVVDRAGQKYVFLADGGQAQIQPVTVGQVEGDVIEILTGLQAGQQVVTTGAGQLNDKDKIKIITPQPVRN
ncbi:MAG: efflux RND transporter periplasmic adaptor subunit [Candidatus Aminicenantales bacterium]